MVNLIWIAIVVHIVVAALVAGAIVVWRAYVVDDSDNSEREH